MRPEIWIGNPLDDLRSDCELFPEILRSEFSRSSESAPLHYDFRSAIPEQQRPTDSHQGTGEATVRFSQTELKSAILAQLADEIILEAAMGHIEQLAEKVMNEDIGLGPGVATGLDMEDHTPIKNTSQLNGIAQNSVVRRRKKEKGFNMSPTLQVVGLDFDYDSDSEQGEEKGLNEWIENLKRKKGYEKEFCKMIDEAQHEVIKFFDKALKESGRPSVNWVHKATSYMLSKIEEYGEKKKVRVEPVKVGKWVDLLKEEVETLPKVQISDQKDPDQESNRENSVELNQQEKLELKEENANKINQEGESNSNSWEEVPEELLDEIKLLSIEIGEETGTQAKQNLREAIQMARKLYAIASKKNRG
nr:hypothetical protein Iba_chr11fCG13630 [Ipomoea batatas]